MDSINVVIDTNVFVCALKSQRGAAYKLLVQLPDGLYTPNVSVPLFLEYETIIKRTDLSDDLNENDIDAILDYFLSQSRKHSIFYLWRPYLRDAKDDLVLEVAVASQSAYIITYNKRDFQGCDKFGIKAVTPREFMLLRGMQ